MTLPPAQAGTLWVEEQVGMGQVGVVLCAHLGRGQGSCPWDPIFWAGLWPETWYLCVLGVLRALH